MGNDDEKTQAHGTTTSATITTVSVPMVSADDEVQLKRQYDELQELFIETQQDQQELAARYGHVHKQLERVHMENEYLMGELRQYTASDLESDQSDVELQNASHARKALPSPTKATESDPAASKSKSKSSAKATESTRSKDLASKPKRKLLSSISTAPSSSLPAATKKASGTMLAELHNYWV